MGVGWEREGWLLCFLLLQAALDLKLEDLDLNPCSATSCVTLVKSPSHLWSSLFPQV